MHYLLSINNCTHHWLMAVFTLSLIIVPANAAHAGWLFGPDNFEECYVDGLKEFKSPTKTVARAIAADCRKRFPIEPKAAVVPDCGFEERSLAARYGKQNIESGGTGSIIFRSDLEFCVGTAMSAMEHNAKFGFQNNGDVSPMNCGYESKSRWDRDRATFADFYHNCGRYNNAITNRVIN